MTIAKCRLHYQRYAAQYENDEQCSRLARQSNCSIRLTTDTRYWNLRTDNRISRINTFDKPSVIFAAVALGFAGTGVAMGLPLLIGSIAVPLGFSDQQLGWLASYDMGGLFVG